MYAPTPALSAPPPVGNDARLIRHPDGRVELTGSLIRVDVLPLTPILAWVYRNSVGATLGRSIERPYNRAPLQSSPKSQFVSTVSPHPANTLIATRAASPFGIGHALLNPLAAFGPCGREALAVSGGVAVGVQ